MFFSELLIVSGQSMTMTSYVVLRRNSQFADEKVEVQIGKVTHFQPPLGEIELEWKGMQSRGHPYTLSDVNLSLSLS